MIFKNFKVLGILLLLLVVFAVGGKKVSAAVEDGDIQYTIHHADRWFLRRKLHASSENDRCSESSG